MSIAHVLKQRIAELESQVEYMSKRHRLPDERKSITRKVRIGDQKIYLTTGKYPDGSLGELFIKIGKHGSEDYVYNMAAIAMSIGIQWGVPLVEYVEKYKHQNMEISGSTSDPNIPMCSSIMDYVAKRLELDYIKGDEK